MIFTFIKDKERTQKNRNIYRYIWMLGGLFFCVLSILEMSRIHQRLGLVNFSSTEPIQIILFIISQLLLLYLLFIFLKQVSPSHRYYWILNTWIVLWGIAIIVKQLNLFIPETIHILSWFMIGLGYLFGGTFLLLFLGSFILEKTTSKYNNS